MLRSAAMLVLSIFLAGCATAHHSVEWRTRAPLSCSEINIRDLDAALHSKRGTFDVSMRIVNHTSESLYVDEEYLRLLPYSLRFTDGRNIEWKIETNWVGNERLSFETKPGKRIRIPTGGNHVFVFALPTSGRLFIPCNKELIPVQAQGAPIPPVTFWGMAACLGGEEPEDQLRLHYIHFYGTVGTYWGDSDSAAFVPILPLSTPTPLLGFLS